MGIPTEWIPKQARTAVLIVFAFLGAFLGGVKALEWLEAKAHAAALAEIRPLESKVDAIARDVNETKRDVKQLLREKVK